MKELIFANLAKHISLTPEEKLAFASALEEKIFPRKSILLKEGRPCTDIYFVCSGTVRAYHISNDGKESTLMFAIADWWITDMYCFVNSMPAMIYIEAVEDSVVLQLDKKLLDHLYKVIPKLERFFRILMQNAYTREQLRMIENLSLTAEERYDRFLHKYPHIAAQVTQKQIASYLGITAEFLSMIRARKAGK